MLLVSTHRGRHFYEARVKVFACQNAEVLVKQLASLKVSMEEVTYYIVCLGDCLQKITCISTSLLRLCSIPIIETMQAENKLYC